VPRRADFHADNLDRKAGTMTEIDPPAPQTLRTRCDPASLTFVTIADLPEPARCRAVR